MLKTTKFWNYFIADLLLPKECQINLKLQPIWENFKLNKKLFVPPVACILDYYDSHNDDCKWRHNLEHHLRS